MKKFLTLLLIFITGSIFLFAGGIVTNQNQSASYIRIYARDATTDIDAVFYNPAGLTKLGDGFYISINDQYILQNKSVESNYTYLNGSPKTYEGFVNAPLFPGLYASYNTGRFAISLGVNPVGGGGSATFDDGLPLFEMSPSDLVPLLSSRGVQSYSMDAYMKGTSIFWGFQLGVSFEINDIISVFAGGRYIYASNSYEGHLRDVDLNMGTYTLGADDFFTLASNSMTTASTGISGIIAAGGEGYTLAQLQGAGYITADQFTDLSAAYTAIGQDPATVTLSSAHPAYFDAAAAQYAAQSSLLADQEGDIKQVGTGITPIIGVNISPTENLNIGIKYEFKTKLELENETADDFVIGMNPDGTQITMFPDGETSRSDMPALLSIGVDYKVLSKLKLSTGFHYYFDKSANYGKKINGVSVDNDQVIDKNAWEFAFGLEYGITDNFYLSAGYLRTKSGIDPDTYQTNLSYSLPSNTIGIGGAYDISPNIRVNIGASYTMYEEGNKNFVHDVGGQGSSLINVTETYDKSNLVFALGFDFRLGGKKSE